MCQPIIENSVCASAPGKVILFGEHAVVFGEPAVAAALSDLRITVKVTPTEAQQVRICMPDLPIPVDVTLESKSLRLDNLVEPPSKADVEAIQAVLISQLSNLNELHLSALTPLIYLMNQLTPSHLLSGLNVSVRSQDLPVGAGLGSSAAFGVACSAALLRLSLMTDTPPLLLLLGKPNKQQLEIINTYSFYSEILLHGTPSGIDNAVSTFGGAIDYKKKDGTTTMDKFIMPPLDMILANTHVPRSTKVLVAGVRSIYEQHPEVIGCILSCMGNIAQDFRKLSDYHGSELLTLVRTNQHMLRSVGVSHPSLDLVCDIVDSVSNGNAAAKLTGAGGGGCAMIVLKSGNESKRIAQRIKTALTQQCHPWNYKCLRSAVGQDGVLWIDPALFSEKRPVEAKSATTTTRSALVASVALCAVLVSVITLQKR